MWVIAVLSEIGIDFDHFGRKYVTNTATSSVLEHKKTNCCNGVSQSKINVIRPNQTFKRMAKIMLRKNAKRPLVHKAGLKQGVDLRVRF